MTDIAKLIDSAFDERAGLTDLEVLIRAEITLADTGPAAAPYEFADWCYCTCGHIYAAVNGTFGLHTDDVFGIERPAYLGALNAMLATYPEYKFEASHGSPFTRVSDLTRAKARMWNPPFPDPTAVGIGPADIALGNRIMREAALRMVRETIARLNAQYDQDMRLAAVGDIIVEHARQTVPA